MAVSVDLAVQENWRDGVSDGLRLMMCCLIYKFYEGTFSERFSLFSLPFINSFFIYITYFVRDIKL